MQKTPRPVVNKYIRLSTIAKNIEKPNLQVCRSLIFVQPLIGPADIIENINHNKHNIAYDAI